LIGDLQEGRGRSRRHVLVGSFDARGDGGEDVTSAQRRREERRLESRLVVARLEGEGTQLNR
jgi:hypothetical protein